MIGAKKRRWSRALAEAIADRLFLADVPAEAARRLVLERTDGTVGGGWCRIDVVDIIYNALVNTRV